MPGLWNWLSDEKNRNILMFLGTGVSALAGAGWVLYTHFNPAETGAKPSSSNYLVEQQFKRYDELEKKLRTLSAGDAAVTAALTQALDAGKVNDSDKMRIALDSATRIAATGLGEKSRILLFQSRLSDSAYPTRHSAELLDQVSDAESLQAYVQAATLFLLSGNLGETRKILDLLADRDSRVSWPAALRSRFRLIRGLHLQLTADLAGAAKQYESIFASFSNSDATIADAVDAYALNALLCATRGSWKDANAFFREAERLASLTEIDPEQYVRLKLIKFEMESMKGDVGAAMQTLTSARQSLVRLQVSPNAWESWILQDEGQVIADVKGDFQSALKNQKASEEKLHLAVGVDSLWRALAQKQRAELESRSGLYAIAERSAESALQSLISIVGESHPWTEEARITLGTILVGQRKYAQAEPVLSKAMASLSKQTSATYPGVLGARLALMQVSRALGNDPERVESSALALRDEVARTFTVNHPSAIAAECLISSIYLDLHRDVEADDLSRKAIEKIEASLGREHPSLIDPLVIRGLVAQTGARYSLSKKYLERARNLCVEALGAHHICNLSILTQLRDTAKAQGNRSQSAHYEGLIEAWRTAPGTVKTSTVGLSK